MWEKAFKNTGLFKFTGILGKSFVPMCKHCNEITPISHTREWQKVGNEYQSIVICKKCKKPFVMDDSDLSNYKFLLNKK